MGYELVDPAEIDPLPNRPSTAIGISDHYVPPGDGDGTVRLLAIGAPSYGVLGRNDGHAYDPDAA